MSENIYLLLNDENVPIAQGVLMTPVDAPQLRVRILNADVDELEAATIHKLVTLVGMLQTMPTLQGEVVGSAYDDLKIRRVASKSDVREMLRVDVAFDSLIYPVDGKWTGKRKVEFIDLSCGGIAFFCDETMERGDEFEIVIPVMPQPIIMRCQILRAREKNGRSCYAAKFVDMCHDEEKLICEAVFAIQLSQQRRKVNGRGVE